jgi:hypothetical protein
MTAPDPFDVIAALTVTGADPSPGSPDPGFDNYLISKYGAVPRFGDLGTYAGGPVVDPDTFHLVRPKKRAGGIVVALYPAAPDHVLVLDEKTGAELVVRIGGKR